MLSTFDDKFPAVASLENATERLRAKLRGGITDLATPIIDRVNPNPAGVRPPEFRRSGPGSAHTAPPPGVRPFLTPESHIAPLKAFFGLGVPGLLNQRNFSVRAAAQNRVLETGRTSVTGHFVMARKAIANKRMLSTTLHSIARLPVRPRCAQVQRRGAKTRRLRPSALSLRRFRRFSSGRACGSPSQSSPRSAGATRQPARSTSRARAAPSFPSPFPPVPPTHAHTERLQPS